MKAYHNLRHKGEIQKMKSILLIVPLLCGMAAAATHSVLLTWTASPTSGVTYNVYRSLTSGSCKTTTVTTGLTATTFTDNAVISGTTYFYSVDAQNGGGKSACTSPDVQVLIPIDPPAPPSGLNATVQ